MPDRVIHTHGFSYVYDRDAVREACGLLDPDDASIAEHTRVLLCNNSPCAELHCDDCVVSRELRNTDKLLGGMLDIIEHYKRDIS